MIHNEIKEMLTKAMKDKDEVRLSVSRRILTAATNILVEKGKKPNEEVSDEDMLTVLKRLSKQHKESADQYRKAGNEEKAKAEEEEDKIVSEFLPELMSEEKIKEFVMSKKEEMNISNEEKGRFIGIVMKDLKDKADGALVSKVVNDVFK